MSEQFKDDASSEGDSQVVALIKRMQQQLTFLEKKIDLLLNQSQERPREKSYPRPAYRTSNEAPRHSAREYGNRREGKYGGSRTERPGENSRGSFGGPKKPFYQKRKERG